MEVTIAQFEIADAPETWAAAGFTVDDDGICRIGSVRMHLVGSDRGQGVIGWSLRGLPADADGGEIDGVATERSRADFAEAAVHANGVIGVDHVVLLSPDLARTVRALQGIGLSPRRERDGELGGTPMRQIFYRLGEVILEVVGEPDAAGEGASRIWGLTHTVADIDATAALLDEGASPVKDAVQPGRRITTLRHRSFGMSVRTALITPHVRS